MGLADRHFIVDIPTLTLLATASAVTAGRLLDASGNDSIDGGRTLDGSSIFRRDERSSITGTMMSRLGVAQENCEN